MKTLKQIREEYNDKFLARVDENLPDELMLEGFEKQKSKKISRASPIPSSKEMPVMLIFRRVQYRVFPNNQVVALYYSNMVNKYLSIPFGADGNLNLSESTILDEEQLNELGGPAGAVAGAALSAGGEVVGDVAKAVGKFILKPLGDNPHKLGQDKAAGSGITKRSSWDKSKPKYGATAQSKLGQADLAQARNITSPQKHVQENKMSDLRKMVNEGVESKTLTINERQVDINIGMAKRILEVYDSVNTKNKKIVESMLNEDLESFKKLLNFSIKV